MSRLINFLKEMSFWQFIGTFVVLAIVISEIVSCALNYYLHGEVTGENIFMAFIIPAIDAFIVLYIAAIVLQGLKDKEKTLSDNDQRFKNLFDLSPDPAWIINDHKFVECNYAAVRMLGYTYKRELADLHPSRLSPAKQPDGEDSFSKAERMMNLAQEIGIHRFEWVHKRADGSEFWSEVTLSPIVLQDKEVIYCTWRDISERKLGQDRLKQSELQFRSIVEGAQDGIVVADIESKKFVDANYQFCEMTGYAYAELMTLGVQDMHPAQDLAEVERIFAAQVRGEMLVAPAIPVLCKDGRVFPADISASHINFKEKKCLVGFFHDISNRVEVENELTRHRDHLSEMIEEQTRDLRAAKEQALLASPGKKPVSGQY